MVKNCVGTGLYAEELPATVIKDKGVSVKWKPWLNYVLRYLDSLWETNLLVDVSFIPSDEISKSLIINPNKAENTVVFSILEAKDNKSNLMVCLERFKTHSEVG